MPRRLLRAPLLAALLVACGGLSGSDGGEAQDEVAPHPAPAAARMHRLTEPEYRTSVGQLLGVSVAERLPGDYRLHGLSAVGAAEVSISASEVELYEAAAWGAAERALPDEASARTRLGCELTARDEDAVDACLAPFALDLARRAWRRPVDRDELDDLIALFHTVRVQSGDPVLGARAVVAAVLQSSWFLFRVEVGTPDATEPGARWLTDHELAARLSAFLTGGLPDDALLADADAGRLTEDAVLRGHAERLLDGPGAHAALARFATELLDLERLDTADKDPDRYPELTPALRAGMRLELESLFADTALSGAPLGEVLTTDRAYLTPELAAHYGASGEGWTTLPGEQERGGLLGRAGLLTLNAHAAATSPTRRGLFVQTRLLCSSVPPPPEGVDTNLEPADPDTPQTARERLTRHREDPACSGCHQLMDPMGLALEHYDPVGAYRTEELGLPIDASFEALGETGDGAAALGATVAASPRFGACMVRQLYRYGIGQHESPAEEAALGELIDAFDAGGQRVRDYLVAFVLHPSFRQVAAPDPEACATEGATRPCGNDCGEGVQTCLGGVWQGCSAPTAVPERCNGIDDDCDGETDEVMRMCEGEWGPGVQACGLGEWSGRCETPPEPEEICNGEDDDGDGRVDEDLAIDRRTVAWRDLLDADGDCAIAGDSGSGPCRAAIHRTCEASDCSRTGFGPIGLDPSRGEATLGCLNATQGWVRVTSYTELAAQHPGCDGSEGGRWGTDCSAAVHRWCRNRGEASGFGPIENTRDTAVVVCTPGATVEEATYSQLVAWSDAALGPCDATTRLGAACDVAIHRDCRARGYETGFGPVENWRDDLMFACLGSREDR